MPIVRCGAAEGFPYSISRWTDVPAVKWHWFRQQLSIGQMWGVDPVSACPFLWSLRPEDTLGLIFWTRDGRNLAKDSKLLAAYSVRVHYTITGWSEVEHRAPNIQEGLDGLRQVVDAFGPDNVTWRFSPIPVVDDVIDRFQAIAEGVSSLGVTRGFMSFLQPNDRLEDKSTTSEKISLLQRLQYPSLDMRLCNENDIPWGTRGICEPWDTSSTKGVKRETCGCALMVDPFTVNETCRFGCEYCYAADKSLAPKKRNTTLQVVQS